jgi:peptidoglycan/LPS O-acetylase OafA/YrhL
MTSRNQWLDVLRGVAILLALAAHFEYHNIRLWSSVGWAGVDLFFVLSGYLISGLLFAEYQKTGSINVVRFWIRRGFKIYPGFYALIIVAFGTLLIAGGIHMFPWRAFFAEIFFVQDYIRSQVFEYTWSLGVEEHFYFLLPLLLIALLRFGRGAWRVLPLISVIVAVTCVGLRMHTPSGEWGQTHLRMDGLFCGVALGYFKHFDTSFPARSHPGFLLASIPFLVSVWLLPRSLGHTFATIAFALLLLWAAPRNSSSFLPVRFLAWIGRYSYAIYLWQVVPNLLFRRFLNDSAIGFGGYIVSAILLGCAMTKLVENPAVKLRDRQHVTTTLTSDANPPIGSINPFPIADSALVQ